MKLFGVIVIVTIAIIGATTLISAILIGWVENHEESFIATMVVLLVVSMSSFVGCAVFRVFY